MGQSEAAVTLMEQAALSFMEGEVKRDGGYNAKSFSLA
jgi:hypothetical protein